MTIPSYAKYFPPASLLTQSLLSFEEVSDASLKEFKRNNNHLLTIKMKSRETLKRYISYFQSQMALIYNCNDDVTAVAFIVGLETNHSFYKHLVKLDVTSLKDILSRTQKYIQLEEATRSSKAKQPSAPPKKSQNRG